jgi:hypothetical protein
MARELLILRGHSVTGLSPATIITRALHTTSDFPLIVGDTIGRTLRAAYQADGAASRTKRSHTGRQNWKTTTANCNCSMRRRNSRRLARIEE